MTRVISARVPGDEWLKHNIQLGSPYGVHAFRNLKKATSVVSLNDEFDELEKIYSLMQQQPQFIERAFAILTSLNNICGTLASLSQQQILAETELFEIKNFTLGCKALAAACKKYGVELKTVRFCDLSAVIKLLNPDETVTPSFYLHDSYSDKLKNLRMQRKIIEDKILLCQDRQTRDNLRLERSEIVALEQREEYQVRLKLGQRLEPWANDLLISTKMVGRLDLLVAKARLASLFPCCRPEIVAKDSGVELLMENAVNPEIALALRAEGKSFTPVSIGLQKGVTILTGANMGGKTVAMMTMAFNARLALLGFFPFAERLVMPVIDYIAFVGGDWQNHAQGLSSFGAEVIRLSEFCRYGDNAVGLALFDEFARSTNPAEGTLFVQALCELLQNMGAYAVVSTHYHGVVLEQAVYYQVVGLKNAAFPDENKNQQKVLSNLRQSMDYRLVRVGADYEVPLDAYNIAGLLGADERFMQILSKYYARGCKKP